MNIEINNKKPLEVGDICMNNLGHYYLIASNKDKIEMIYLKSGKVESIYDSIDELKKNNIILNYCKNSRITIIGEE